jgi:hypothetical protein
VLLIVLLLTIPSTSLDHYVTVFVKTMSQCNKAILSAKSSVCGAFFF